MSDRIRAIASARSVPHLRGVSPTRLIRFLTLLALALTSLAPFVATPASAAARHAAMAASHRMAGHEMPGHDMAGHDMAGGVSAAAMRLCNDMGDAPADQPCGSSEEECVKACAAVPGIPAASGNLEPHAVPHAAQLPPALVSVPQGLDPEAETPPPRTLLNI